MTFFSIQRIALTALLLWNVYGCAVVDTGVNVVKVGASVVGTTAGVAGTVASAAVTTAGVAVATAGVAKTVAVSTVGVAAAATSAAVAAGSLVISATTSAANARRADDVATVSVVSMSADRFSGADGRVWVTRNCGDIVHGQPALWVALRSGDSEIRVNESTTCPVVAAE